MRRFAVLLGLVLFTTAAAFGGVERGNRLFRDGRYEEAVQAYRAALEDGTDTPVLHYNLGTALLRLGRYDEAEAELRAALKAVEPATREDVYYNLGSRFLEDARRSPQAESAGPLYDAAVEAYRQALRLSPGDAAAKWNYELALRERERQRQQQGGGGGGKQDREQEPQQGGQGGGGQARGEQQPQPAGGEGAAPSPLTREQAERILSAVEQNEREVFQDKLRKGHQQTRAVRDW